MSLRKLGEDGLGAERAGVARGGEAVRGSPSTDGDHHIPGSYVTEQELETPDLVSTVEGGRPVFPLDPQLGHTGPRRQHRMRLEGRRPRSQTARTESRAYLSGEIRGIQRFEAFHRE